VPPLVNPPFLLGSRLLEAFRGRPCASQSLRCQLWSDFIRVLIYHLSSASLAFVSNRFSVLQKPPSKNKSQKIAEPFNHPTSNMGQKHNRRRTRSRPRNRNQNANNSNHVRMLSSSSSLSDVPAIPPLPAGMIPQRYGTPLTSIGRLPAHRWDAQYAAWQAWQAAKDEEDEEDERLLRMFGGEKGDETSLCGPMLQVVMDLFDGIDYEDP
jgi:hypothetical protein